MLWVISFNAIRLRLEGLGARVVRGAEVTPNKLQTNKLTCQHMSYVMTLLDIYNFFTLDQQLYTQNIEKCPKIVMTLQRGENKFTNQLLISEEKKIFLSH